MTKYTTRQRKILTGFLARHADEQWTARQIAGKVESEGISLSAVYRNLSELEAEGRLKRSSREGERDAYYQFTDVEGCRNCLHMICRRCGKTVHMNSEDTERLVEALALREHFRIDKAGTVLYGLCEGCT